MMCCDGVGPRRCRWSRRGIGRGPSTRGPDAILSKGTTVEMVLDRPLQFSPTDIDFRNQMPRAQSSDGPGPQPSRKLQDRGRWPVRTDLSTADPSCNPKRVPLEFEPGSLFRACGSLPKIESSWNSSTSKRPWLWRLSLWPRPLSCSSTTSAGTAACNSRCLPRPATASPATARPATASPAARSPAALKAILAADI